MEVDEVEEQDEVEVAVERFDEAELILLLLPLPGSMPVRRDCC